MTMSVLWPLCLLPLIGIIIIFYLLKQPTKEKLLSSLSYWQSIYKQQRSERPWEKLRQDLLMYLQILAVLFLILSLCSPIIHSVKKKEQVMLIFDTSASMQSLYSSNGTTRLEQAKKEAKKWIESSKHPLEITIISCSNQAQVLLNSSTNYKTVFSILNNIEQKDSRGTLNNAIPLCESIYSQWEHGTCVFFTDSSLHTNSLPAQIYDLSTSTAAPKEPLLNTNLFISYIDANINRDTNNITIHAVIDNAGNTSASSDINFYINNTLVDIQTYDKRHRNAIQSKQIPLSENFSYPLIIKAEIQEPDALIADNTAYHIVNKEQKNSDYFRVLLASKQNSFLEKALITYRNCYTINSNSIDVYKINSIQDYNPKETYDLFIFDGIFPEKLPKTGSVLLFPDAKHIKNSGKILQELLPEITCGNIIRQQYLNLVDSTVASQNLDNVTFPIAKALSITAPAGAETIFTFDEGKGCGYMERNNHRFLTVFGFDLHDSNLPLKIEFPILMCNIFHECLQNTVFFPNDHNNTAGEPIFFYPFAAKKKISIRNEQGKEIKSLTPSSPFNGSTVLETCGIYDFYTKSEKYHAYLAVEFPYYYESELLAAPEFTSDTEDGTHTVTKTKTTLGISLEKLFIILSLLFLIAEFIVWLRRQWIQNHSFFLIIRTCLILFLCLSILDIRVTLGKATETTLFLVDVSDSMKSDLSSMETLLEQAMHDLPSGSKAGIIAFGADARVEQFISHKINFNGLETTVSTTATNLENALHTATYMFSNEDSKRIVLLTDGQENAGTVENMVSLLKDNKISLKVLKFPKNQAEVLVSGLRVPEKLAIGETFQVEVTILSNVDTNATLSLYSGDTLKDIKQVSLTSGKNRFLFQDTLTKSGLNTYRTIVEAEKDTEILNNEYITFTQADKKQKLLLIEGRKGEATEFEKILKAGNFSYKKILPFAAPQKLISLKKYSAIILENVHADDLPENFRKLLHGYLTEGGGLIAIGGDNSFALGNYQNTSLDSLLPVKSILPAEQEVPEAAMTLLIDHSSSMGDGNKQITRLELAKEAAISALSSLRETDSIGVLAFDDTYHWVVPFTKASDFETIQLAIGGIQIKGGTSIYPAVAEAVKQLSKKDAKQKHIILLTDGEDNFKDYQDLYQTMEKENITLSTVAVSNGADTKLLQSMAKAGNGRYYYTDISTDIPRIFAQEVFLSSDAYLVNKETTPKLYSGPSSVSLYETLSTSAKVLTRQPLYGYIRTAPNMDSHIILTSNSSDPILALKRVGLGTTAAFTSDVTNEWTSNYASLDNYAQFWKNLIQSCILTKKGPSTDNLTVTTENNMGHITYISEFNAINEQDLLAICTDEDGNSVQVPLSYSPSNSFNSYKGDIELEHNGVYSLTITNGKISANGNEALANLIFANTYSMEYQLYDDDSTIDNLISLTDAELISSSKDFYTGKLERNMVSHTLTPFLLVFTLLLFMADIAMRRFGISYSSKLFKPFQIRIEKIHNNIVKKKSIIVVKPIQNQQQKKEQKQEIVENQKKSTIRKPKKKISKNKTNSELLDTSILLTSRKPKNKN